MIRAVAAAVMLVLSSHTTLAADDAPAEVNESAEAQAVRKQVDRLNAVLIESMKRADLGYSGRYKLLEPVVGEVFRFESVAQIALGAHWKQLSASQQNQFVAKLRELSVATYAAQFNSYDGESFRYDSVQVLKPEKLVARYDMVAGDEKPVRFEYLVINNEGRWAIVSIMVDGINDLALKKAQYTSIIDREGFDSLMQKLTQKISDYASDKSVSAAK